MAKVSKRTGNRRLLKLAVMLEADAKNKKGIQFDINVVGKPSYVEDGPIVEFKSMADVKLDCVTTACAMGLAAISGKFKKAGLSACVDDSMIYTKWNGRIMEAH